MQAMKHILRSSVPLAAQLRRITVAARMFSRDDLVIVLLTLKVWSTQSTDTTPSYYPQETLPALQAKEHYQR